MSTSHKHGFAVAKESKTAIMAADTLGRVVFKEVAAIYRHAPMLVRFYDLVEKPFLEEVLKHANGNQLKAADMLGINRSTLRRLCRRYGIVP